MLFQSGRVVKLRPQRNFLAGRILAESEDAKGGCERGRRESRDRVLLKLLYVSGVRVSAAG